MAKPVGNHQTGVYGAGPTRVELAPVWEHGPVTSQAVPSSGQRTTLSESSPEELEDFLAQERAAHD